MDIRTGQRTKDHANKSNERSEQNCQKQDLEHATTITKNKNTHNILSPILSNGSERAEFSGECPSPRCGLTPIGGTAHPNQHRTRGSGVGQPSDRSDKSNNRCCSRCPSGTRKKSGYQHHPFSNSNEPRNNILIRFSATRNTGYGTVCYTTRETLLENNFCYSFVFCT